MICQEDVMRTGFFEAVCQVPGNDTLVYNLGLSADLRQTCDGYDAMDGLQHILVVDDDKELRGLLSRFLTGNGFRVSVAQDSAAMTQAMSAARIDLVILDIMMPGEDGLSICRRLRANGTVPIIMLTAKGSEFDRVAGLEIGADDYLSKPFSIHELLARVRAVLRRAAMPVPGSPAGARRVFEFAGWRLGRGREQELRSPAGNALVDAPCRRVRRAPRARRTSAAGGADPEISCSILRGDALTTTFRPHVDLTSAGCAAVSRPTPRNPH